MNEKQNNLEGKEWECCSWTDIWGKNIKVPTMPRMNIILPSPGFEFGIQIV